MAEYRPVSPFERAMAGAGGVPPQAVADETPPAFGRLTPYQPSLRDKLASFFIGDSRPSPEMRGNLRVLFGSSGLGQQGMGAVDFAPVLGTTLAGDEAKRAYDDGDYIGAAANGGAALIGVAPAALAAAKIGKTSLQSVTKAGFADDTVLASRSPKMYDLPDMPQRPLSADYPPEKWPHGPPVDPATGRLTHDIDGRAIPVHATVAGRRFGDDALPQAPLSAAELNAITADQTGTGPVYVAASRIGGDAGRLVTDRRTGARQMFIDKNLNDADALNVFRHEFGHLVDATSQSPKTDGVMLQLRDNYNRLNNPFRDEVDKFPRRAWDPQANGYTGKSVMDELIAEAHHGYGSNPNAFKTLYPELAARMRAATASNWHLRYNALPLAGGGLSAAHVYDRLTAPMQEAGL